jgi:hypothetical protein
MDFLIKALSFNSAKAAYCNFVYKEFLEYFGQYFGWLRQRLILILIKLIFILHFFNVENYGIKTNDACESLILDQLIMIVVATN